MAAVIGGFAARIVVVGDFGGNKLMLVFDNLTLGYNRHPVVHHLNLSLARASFTALVGGNGAGKSTLLKSILGLLPPLEGSIVNHAKRVAYMPQQSRLERDFPLLVEQVAAAGLWAQTGAFKAIGREHKHEVLAALAKVKIEHLAKRSVGELSGGQFQRLLFARLLLQNAELLLLDEPFNGVDAATVADMLALLQNLNQAGATILLVAHDLDLVRAQIPDSMLLATELVAHGESTSVLSAANLARARELAAANSAQQLAKECQF